MWLMYSNYSFLEYCTILNFYTIRMLYLFKHWKKTLFYFLYQLSFRYHLVLLFILFSLFQGYVYHNFLSFFYRRNWKFSALHFVCNSLYKIIPTHLWSIKFDWTLANNTKTNNIIISLTPIFFIIPISCSISLLF